MSGARLLSILIPTLVARQALFDRLHTQLRRQIDALNAGAVVEVLWSSDDGTEPTGSKRNRLMGQASGRFIVFVDDDDRVSADYVAQILAAIRANPGVDCISCAGEIRFRGRHPRKLVHSIAYRDWYARGGHYLRPPCHITPIRREIALRYRFAAIDVSEDMDWTLRICRDGALRDEVVIERILYYYDSRRHYGWQWLLDNTQTARHALGLRWVNRLGLGQRLAAWLRISRG